MPLLDLPVDLFHEVLLQGVISRGVTRALRLKLVCKQFQRYLQPALFESRLLDEYVVEARVGSKLTFMEDWYIRHRHGLEKFWHAYLVYRVHNETDPNKGGFVAVRQIAEQICEQTETEHETVVSELCWLALERGTTAPGFPEGWGWSEPSDKTRNAGSSLLSAAAYLGHIGVARQLLSEGLCPVAKGPLFPSPMQLAAYAGNSDILRLFQEHLPDFEDTRPPGVTFPRTWRGKTGPGSIKGAMMRGDIDILRLAICPPSLGLLQNTNFCGLQFGHVEPKCPPGIDLEKGLYHAKTLEAFQYVESFFGESCALSSRSSALLAHYAELGNIEIVGYLLDGGAKIDGGTFTNQNPLTIACRNCHGDIVDLLLQRGADPSYKRLQWLTCPLYAATSGGSIYIVRRLLARGATYAAVNWEPISAALQLEHTAMVELILEFREWSERELRSMARVQSAKGLESMASLLLSKIEASPVQVVGKSAEARSIAIRTG
ncbi:ankyrin repeat-containing domain protein [Cadophora sp. MPI-SDFR-AT-0126]|nr:ankyrin repeat-containing domain protein [Leotiomycetes sp. MPI-SDFR-AT-0126]